MTLYENMQRINQKLRYRAIGILILTATLTLTAVVTMFAFSAH